MKLSVIIVSYNVKYFVWQCLNSLFHALHDIESEVFVVDNNSSDGTVEFLEAEFPSASFPNLILIKNQENLGFGKANNLAARQSRGEYVLFLNPDTIICEDTLSKCLAFATSKDRFGGLGVKMLHDNGRFAYESRRGIPTPWTAFCKLSGLASLFPQSRTFGKYYMRYLDKNEPSEIEIISGAFMFVSKKALDDVGSFDERFFMYGEDIDLSYRFLLGGYKNYYLPLPILHYKGESTRKNSYGHVKTFYQAMSIFFQKYNVSGKALSMLVETGISACTLLSMSSKLLRRGIMRLRSVSKSAGGITPPLVVFNAWEQTYGEMMAAIEKSDHKQYLAVKYPQKNIIITSGNPITI